MKTTNLLFISLIGIFTLASCEEKSTATPMEELNPEETFVEADAPEEFVHGTIAFKTPWGYKKEDNASRRYPILVSGMWNEGRKFYQDVAQQFPAFVITYKEKTETRGMELGDWIRAVVDKEYRIDTNRIYLTGFSYGGSSSYPLAKGMYKKGTPFAAVIRVAGQSKSDLSNEVAEKTAVWYHIGLNDKASRVDVAHKAIELVQSYDCYNGATESTVTDTITGYDRKTVTLTRSGIEMFKYSEYTNMGHTPTPCYRDKELFVWLFNHSLKNR